MMRAVALTGLAAALLGVSYGWYRWRGVMRDLRLPTWRRATSTLGLFAVTAQALLLMTMYAGEFIRNPAFFDRWWFPGQVFLCVIAIPCAVAGRGPSRWWLSAS